MPTAAIYKIGYKKYFLHSDVRAASGFSLASEPFIQVATNNADPDTIASAIKAVLNSDDSERIPDPKNWGEFNKRFLQKSGLKSLSELNRATTMNCGITKENENILFTPTKHAEPPDQGFVNKSKHEPNIIVPYSASNQDIMLALELALSRCE